MYVLGRRRLEALKSITRTLFSGHCAWAVHVLELCPYELHKAHVLLPELGLDIFLRSLPYFTHIDATCLRPVSMAALIRNPIASSLLITLIISMRLSPLKTASLIAFIWLV